MAYKVPDQALQERQLLLVPRPIVPLDQPPLPQLALPLLLVLLAMHPAQKQQLDLAPMPKQESKPSRNESYFAQPSTLIIGSFMRYLCH